MSDPFDPYLKWLGIPPKHQPPHDYRLLGIELYESDPDVITNAADQRMAHLKNFATGKYSRLSQQLLNEISAARVRLLNPEQKARYDAALHQQLSPARPAVRSPGAASGTDRPKPAPPVQEGSPPIFVARGLESPGDVSRPRRRPSWLPMAAVAGGIAAIVLVLGVIYLASRPSSGPTQANLQGAKPTQPRPEPAPKATHVVPPAVETAVPKTTEPKTTEPKTTEPEIATPGTTARETATPVVASPEPSPPEPMPAAVDPVDPSRTRPGDSRTLRNENGLGDLLSSPDPPAAATSPNQAERGSLEAGGSAPPTVGARLAPSKSPSPPVPPIETKLPEPQVDEKQEAEREIRKFYRGKFGDLQTPEKKAALASELSRVGLGTNDDPVHRFVLLKMACSLWAEAGDMDRALALLDRIGGGYDVDVLAMKADVLSSVYDGVKGSARTPEALVVQQRIVAAAQQLSKEAFDASDLGAAGRFLRIAIPAAHVSSDSALKAELERSSKELKELEPRAELAQKAVAALAANPGHPRASLVAGSWYCFVVNDWGKGLPWLASGEDAGLAGLAKQDLANPQQPDQQVAVGDGWWELGKAKKGIESTRLQERAAYWYRRALPKLTGFARTKLEKQIGEMGISAGLYALKFDGKRSHVVVNNFGYAGGPITVEVLVRPGGEANPAGVSSEETLFGNLGSSGLALCSYGSGFNRYCSWSFKFFYNYTYVSTYTTTVSARLVQVGSSSSTITGKWLHVAGTYDGTKIQFYIEGVGQGAMMAGPHRPNAAAPFVIGANPAGPATPEGLPVNGFFTGMVKAVRISDRVLYTANFDPPSELTPAGGTRLLLQFSQGTGTRVKNASGERKAFAEIKDAEWVLLDSAEPDPASADPAPTIRR